MANAASSYTRGVEVGPDPWGGSTLEWFTLSPPPAHNFDLVPDVRSAEPLLDIREAIRRRNVRWTPPPAVLPDREPEPVAGSAVDRPEDENDTPVAERHARSRDGRRRPGNVRLRGPLTEWQPPTTTFP